MNPFLNSDGGETNLSTATTHTVSVGSNNPFASRVIAVPGPSFPNPFEVLVQASTARQQSYSPDLNGSVAPPGRPASPSAADVARDVAGLGIASPRRDDENRASIGGATHVSRCAYSPQEEDECGLAKGDLLFVSSIGNDGWCTGQNLRTGCTGTFPSNFVSALELPGSGEGSATVASKASAASASLVVDTKASRAVSQMNSQLGFHGVPMPIS